MKLIPGVLGDRIRDWKILGHTKLSHYPPRVIMLNNLVVDKRYLQ
jgi:hypothetical protein